MCSHLNHQLTQLSIDCCFLFTIEAKRQRPIMPQLNRHFSRSTCCCAIVNSTILVLLAGACVFFSIYDVKVEGIFWSLGIYIPCLSLFLYDLFAWYRHHRPAEQKREDKDDHASNGNGSANAGDNFNSCHLPEEVSRTIHLKIFGAIMGILSTGLIGYGMVLCVQFSGDGDAIWGPMTICLPS